MSNYSEGAIHALANQLEKHCFSPEEVRLLGEADNLRRILSFLRSETEIVIKTHVIDCNVDPFIPDGWKVEEHIKGGELHWNPDKVELYLCDEQKAVVIEGNKLRKKLKGKSVLNANVLDYLLKNPQLIPKDWKGKVVFFWGTIYRNSDGDLCVRDLYWDGDRWDWNRHWLGNYFSGSNPAVFSCK